jgi:predicted P-loop ATPase
MSNINKNISKTALKYYDAGYNIFPLKKMKKEPASNLLPEGSQNSLLEEPFTEDQIADIFTKNAKYNIAAHTGEVSNIVVIDIDVSKKDGKDGKRVPKEAEKLAKQFLSLFGDTKVHRTPSGGIHLLYKYEDSLSGLGRQINAFKDLPDPKNVDIDVLEGKKVTMDLRDIDILGGNGYVVLPPSKTDKGDYKEADFSNQSLGLFPIELLRLLPKQETNSGKTRSVLKSIADNTKIPESNSKEQKVKSKWAKNGHNKLLKKISKYMNAESGERHDNLVKICATVTSLLPFEEWGQARSYVDSVTSSFEPRYDDSDEREIVNAIEWAKAMEYRSRIEAGNVSEAKKVFESEESRKKLGMKASDYNREIDECLSEMQKNDKNEPLTNANNIEILLRVHPIFRGKIKYDEFSEKVTYRCKYKGVEADHEMDTSSKDPMLNKLYIDVQKEFFPKASQSDVKSAAIAAASLNFFDSYEDYMDGLKGEWDGEERLANWLHEVYNLPDDDYHRGISSQFIFAMVRRAYEPGAEFQRALFLSGEQGVGKTAAMNIIAGEDWFTEFSDELMGREFGLHIRGRTLIDLSEGETMRKTSISKLKQMITDARITLRGFHTEKVEDHPMRCVLSITNNDSPLLDLTGNRRYWVVRVPLDFNEVGRLDWLSLNRDQIFAEAVHKYHQTKKIEKRIDKKIEKEEREEVVEELMKRRRMLWSYEVYFSENQKENEVGISYVPREKAEKFQSDSQMVTPLQVAVRRVLLSYDEYRAGHKDFFIKAEEVMEQVEESIIRQSRLGSYALTDIGKTILSIDEKLEKGRSWSGETRGDRGYLFAEASADSESKLSAIKRIRENSESTGTPSEFSGKKYVREAEKVALIRYRREQKKYVPITSGMIETEMSYEGTPREGSVRVTAKNGGFVDEFNFTVDNFNN